MQCEWEDWGSWRRHRWLCFSPHCSTLLHIAPLLVNVTIPSISSTSSLVAIMAVGMSFRCILSSVSKKIWSSWRCRRRLIFSFFFVVNLMTCTRWSEGTLHENGKEEHSSFKLRFHAQSKSGKFKSRIFHPGLWGWVLYKDETQLSSTHFLKIFSA